LGTTERHINNRKSSASGGSSILQPLSPRIGGMEALRSNLPLDP
jgi:hypothetical protein